MKKILLGLFLLCSAFAAAQTTPNYGFQVPPFNAPNWNTTMNQNWYSLDNILQGFALGSSGGLQCHPLSSFSTPPSGVLTVACCSDCQATNPCSPGGSGQMALGLNGTYNCTGGSGGGGGGLQDPGANGIIKRTGINVTAIANFADFASLLTGTASSGFFARGDGVWAAPPGSGVTSSATSPGPLAFYFGTAPSTQVEGDPNCIDDGNGSVTCLGLAAGVVAATGSGANGPQIPNASGGTTSGLLAKIVAGQAITATTSDTAVPVFVVLPTVTIGGVTICSGGTSGNSCLGTSGQAACTTDAGGATANHFLIASTTTAGRCHDAGGSLPSGPVCYVGQAVSTVSANASVQVSIAPNCYPVGSGTGVADPGGNGFMSRTALNVSINRSLSNGTGIATITNPDGVSGNPVIAIDTATVWNTTDTLGATTNKTLDAEGSGNVLSRPFYVMFAPSCNNAAPGPGDFDVPTTGGPTFLCFGTTTTQGTADFPDAVVTTITGRFVLPLGWLSSTSMDLRIGWFANSASANAIRWSVQTGCVGIGDAMSTGPSYNAASAVNSAYTGTANQRQVTSITGVDMTNCASGGGGGKLMYFQIQRVGTNAGDTLTVDGQLSDALWRGRAQN